MDLMSSTLEAMVDSFTIEEELMNFAATWGVQESPIVQLRLFQLRNPLYDACFVNEELNSLLFNLGGPSDQTSPSVIYDDLYLASEYVQEQVEVELPSVIYDDLNLASEYVQEQVEVEECIKALLFDDEIEDLSRICMEDGDWYPLSPVVQIGGGEEPGPSRQTDTPHGLQYTMRKKSERTYAKNAAVDRTYQVKVDEQYHGQQLQDVREGLHDMFQEVLNEARGVLEGNDLGRVVIHHEGLHDPIIVPLRPWDQLNAETIMAFIEKVLNSNQELEIDQSFEITVGSIDLPKGGTRRCITRLKGKNNSLQLKTSLVTIENNDQLCMARAIGVGWAKLKRCSPEEWKDIPRENKRNIDLVLEHHKVPLSFYKDLTRKNLKQQKQLAAAISQLAGVPLDRPASLNDVPMFEEFLGVRVMVVSARLGNKFITSPSADRRPCIYLYLVDDDHFHTITSITGFFSASYFCDKCLKHYNKKKDHRCETSCIVCKRDNCLETEIMMSCHSCHMTCRSDVCFNTHKQISVHHKGRNQGKPSGPSQCEKWWKCPKCYKVLRTDKRNKEEHECGEYLCSSCTKYVMNDHLCYLRATPAKEHNIPKFIFFDFECSQDETMECQEGYRTSHCKDCQSNIQCKSCTKCQNCLSSWCGKAIHKPNFVVAHTVCPKCIDKALTPESICKGCGTRCEECDNTDLYDNEDMGPCPGKCGFRETIFKGEETSTTFGKWLFSDQHEYFTVVAHNMKGYDGYFLLEYLIDQSIRPAKIIYNGSKIMYMEIEKGLHMKVIDSLNFLPMKLASFPKAFGLNELKKGWFPHFFNTRENQNYIGSYPDSNYYGVNFMSEKERGELIAWLDEKKECVFNFKNEMLEYCRSDVDILRKSCLKFRDLLMRATGEEREVVNKKGKKEKRWFGAVDPFDSVTIASVCMSVFRTKFLEEKWRVKLTGNDEWLPSKVVDEKLYVQKENEWIYESNLSGETVCEREFVSSAIARIPPSGYNDQHSKVSIQWLEWVATQQGVNIKHALNDREKTLPVVKYKLDGYCVSTNTAYEYHGCVFHGCPECFPDADTPHPLTRQSMRELYALTMKKKTYIESLGMKYVCIWDHEFQELVKNDTDMKNFVEHLDLADRLDPRDSFFGGRTNASQLYYGVKEKEQIKYVDFTSLYPWVNKYCQYPVGHPSILIKDFEDISQYFGIAKVKILPPRGLYHPVLPYRSNGKLKFPLCRTCADNERQDVCTCTGDQRSITGTWCTPEIQKAIELGYVVLKIYEIYHWDETTQYDPETQKGGLFSKYINTFLKFKQEASGAPDWIGTETNMKTYIKQYFEKEGVALDWSLIVKNPGMRALAKLCLNSFWGKFGQRLNLKQTQFFHESEVDQFFQLFTDPLKEVQNFHIVSDDIIQMEWAHEKGCLPEDNKTNIYLATLTTCWARLKLYSILETLNRRVLYYDTDSVIYVSRPGQYDPPLGDYLGELTDELDGEEHIVEFVSGGPKNYAYRTNTGKETCKVRGFTLNYTNSRLINFETVKSLVTDRKSKQTITIINPNKICRDKMKRKLYNRQENKNYQMVYTKRRRLDGFDTEPYGF